MDLRVALGCLLPWSRAGLPGEDRARRARATLLFPLVGAMLGGALAVSDRALAPALPMPARAAVLISLLALSSRDVPLRGLVRVLPAGSVLRAGTVLAVLAVKVLALASTGDELGAPALLLAPTLGRWAPVVLAHGARPVGGPPDAPLLVGRVAFREFGWSSVLAFGFAMSVADALGLVAVVGAALLATGMRLWAYRRHGMVSSDVLAASIEVVETTVLVLLGFVAWL